MRALNLLSAAILITVMSAVTPLPALSQNSDDGSWMFRLRGTVVSPDEEATISEINGDAKVEESYVPELDITFFLGRGFALELILATTNHDVAVVDTDIGDVTVGDVWLLPPTLTLQYHLFTEAEIHPYIGAGVNYTIFYGEDVPGDVVTAADYDNAFGLALQAGVDVPVNDAWSVNLDLKKIFLSTDLSLNDGDILADVTLDPWVISAGIGYRLPG